MKTAPPGIPIVDAGYEATRRVFLDVAGFGLDVTVLPDASGEASCA